jgi:hypothetical protein
MAVSAVDVRSKLRRSSSRNNRAEASGLVGTVRNCDPILWLTKPSAAREKQTALQKVSRCFNLHLSLSSSLVSLLMAIGCLVVEMSQVLYHCHKGFSVSESTSWPKVVSHTLAEGYPAPSDRPSYASSGGPLARRHH